MREWQPTLTHRSDELERLEAGARKPGIHLPGTCTCRALKE